MRFPLKALGVDLGRTVTVIRLASGKLVIHSTAPFSRGDVSAIRALGEPGWLAEAMARHDTFSEEGRSAFPEAVFLAPEGLTLKPGGRVEPLPPAPAEWGDELETVTVEGAPAFRETEFFHRPSQTLIVADLLVNFPEPLGLWKRLLLRLGTVRGAHAPGFTRPFKNAIHDQAAFQRSVERILDWDFQRIIVGHGTAIRENAKSLLRATLSRACVLRPGSD